MCSPWTICRPRSTPTAPVQNWAIRPAQTTRSSSSTHQEPHHGRKGACIRSTPTVRARALVGPFGYTETDVQFGPSPIAHTTGLVTSVLLPMLTGAATHLMAKWNPARGIDEIQRFGCTAAVTAPTFLHTLLSEYNAERHDLSRLRLWTCAGAPIPAAVVQQASATFPN